MSNKPLVVLAFSGGLDTSFCVPYLIEKGFAVHTVFVNTGGMGEAESGEIAARAHELGAVGHTTRDAGEALWSSIVVPFVMGGAKYQDRYPLLCSDRYAIAAETVRVAEMLGAAAIAHGCTAMGNDQFRFDQSFRSLTGLRVLAPIREIQAETDEPRRHEIGYLERRGFGVGQDAKRYTINENVLGVTVSGSEIDGLGAPGAESRRITSPRSDWPDAPLRVEIGFERGVPVSLNGEGVSGIEMLATLNRQFGAYGVGRGIYSGDTIVGLKGRIVFESPGLEVLLTAHKALEELTLTRCQNGFKPRAAREWAALVFGGQFYEPLRADLEALLVSTQRNVSGVVSVETEGGSCEAVAVRAAGALMEDGAVYAQKAGWSAADAEGFIKIAGNASALGSAAAARLEAGGAGSVAEIKHAGQPA